jgi:hypothetical protein
VQTPEDLDENAHNQPFHRAFWVNNENSYDTELRFAIEKQDGDGYNDYQDLDTVAADHYADVFGQSEGPILSLLVVIPTADTNLEGAGDVADGCVGDGQNPDDFGEWVETCGIRYLREQKYGQYFLFSIVPEEAEQVTSEPEQMWDFLTRRLQIGAYDNQSTEDAMAQIANRYPDLTFYITGWDQTTGSAPGLPEEQIVAEQFPEFVDHYETAAANAISQDTLEGLGVPIWQYTPVYDATSYIGELCQIPGDVTDAFICYQNVQDRVRYFEERIKPLIPIYIDAINNPADYKQPNEANEWNAYINGPYADAVNDIPGLVGNCEASLASGDAQQICGACNPSGSLNEAVQSFGSLTYPQPAPNPNHPTASGLSLTPASVKSTDSPNEEVVMHRDSGVCAWSFISGKLDDYYTSVGGGLFPTVNDTWSLSAYSPNTSSSELITTRAYCTDQIVQGPNCGGQLCAWNERCVSGTCQYDNGYYLNSVDQVSALVSNNATDQTLDPAYGPDKPMLGMAASISGNFRGLGEEMWVTHNGPTQKADVDWTSQQGTGMRGFSTAVVVKDPGLGTSTNFRDVSIDDQNVLDAESNTLNASAGQSEEVTIGSANQSFCYLTGVGGQFDGSGESIRLVERSGSWVLITRSAGVGDCNCGALACGCDFAKELRARARCIDYIQ